MAEHAKDVEILQKLSKELSNMGPEGSMAQIQGKIDILSNNFNAFKDTVKEKYVKMAVAELPADPHVLIYLWGYLFSFDTEETSLFYLAS